MEWCVEWCVEWSTEWCVEWSMEWCVECCVPSVDFLHNVQPHDFSQVIHLPHFALILLYVEAVLTPCSG